MKKVLYKVLALVAAISSVACGELTTEGISTITHFVVLELEGDSEIYVALGDSYTDPGFTAVEGADDYETTTDVSSSVEVSGTVNTSTVGVYPIDYYVENSDGYPTTASRTVFVYDPAYAGATAEEIAGTYTLTDASYRMISGTATKDLFSESAAGYSSFTVSLSETCTGIYFVSDFAGAWFKTYMAYGSSYNLSGYITLDAAGTIEPLYYTTVSGWEAYSDELTNGSFEVATSTLVWDLDFAGEMSFHIELSK